MKPWIKEWLWAYFGIFFWGGLTVVFIIRDLVVKDEGGET